MTIDFGKLPVEKAFHLIAKVLPGLALLLLYNAQHPGTIHYLFAIPSLGYNTKLALVASICFVSGYSLTTLLATVSGAIGGAIGYVWASRKGDRHPYQDSIAPWRDERWRTAYEKYYGTAAPKNLKLVPKGIVDDLLQESAVLSGTQTNQDDFILRVSSFNERLSGAFDAVLNDKEWRRCYERLHAKTVLERRMEAIEEIMYGLDSDLSTCAIIALLGASICPSFRIWWLMLGSACWLLVTIIRFSAQIYRLIDPWATLSQQIELLNTGES